METSRHARKPKATAWILTAVAGVPSIGSLSQHALAGNPIKVNGTFVASGNGDSADFTSDSSRIIYAASQNTAGVNEVFNAPSSGGGLNVRLNGNLVAGGSVGGFNSDLTVSPDSGRVVYVADQNVNDKFELFSVPSTGGTAIKLNGILVAGGNVSPGVTTLETVRISPDSTRVFYIADQNVDEQYELFSVPLTGGSAVKLNGTLVAGGDVIPQGFTPDSSRVIYTANQNVSDVIELFSVPSAGGTAAKISGTLVAGGNVDQSNILISPDSSRVVYRADATNNDVFELYAAPTAGGAAPTKLNGPFLAGSDVVGSSWHISPDSSRVTYIADQNTDGVNELYSVAITGGATTKLNGALVAGGNVAASVITPNGSRALYFADQTVDGVLDIYSVPITGGTAVKLNAPYAPGGTVHAFAMTPDSSRLIYTADTSATNGVEMLSVPVTGGTATKIGQTPAVGGSPFNISVTPDSSRVVYQYVQTATSPIELFLTNVLGGQPVKLSGPMVSGGNVDSYTISPDGSRVLFKADANSDGVLEFFIRYIEDKWNSAAGDWDAAGNWNNNVAPDEAMKTTIAVPANVVLSGAATRSAWSLQVGGGTGSSVVQLQGSAGLTIVNGLMIANNGVVRGDGLIVGDVVIQPGGEVRAGAGDHLHFNGSSFNNSGRIEAIGASNLAEIEFSTPLTNLSTGSINASHAILRFNAGLNNQGSVTISSGDNSVFGAVANASGSEVIITGGAITTFYGNVINNAGSDFRVSSGTAVFLAPVTGTANFSGAGMKIFESTTSPGPLATGVGDTTITSTGNLTASYIREDALSVQGLAAIIPNGSAASVSRVNSLSITGGRLDLADNDLILDQTSLSTVASYLAAGYSNGSWTGTGLSSSNAAAAGAGAHKTALGFAPASAIGATSFDGQSVDGSDVLVRYTWSGDANLDGLVNALDFNALATNFGGAGKLWFNGDFNYDGQINTQDFTQLAGNFNLALPAPALGSLVPEPAALAAILLGAASLRRRRRD